MEEHHGEGAGVGGGHEAGVDGLHHCWGWGGCGWGACGGHTSGNGHTSGGHGHGLHFLARILEGGLCDRVVLGHEVELDHVVLGGLDALGGVDEAGGAADGDLEVGVGKQCFRGVGVKVERAYSVGRLWWLDGSVHLLHLGAAACVGRDDDDGVGGVHHGVAAAITSFVSLHVPSFTFGLDHLCAARFLAVHPLALLAGLILLALSHHLARYEGNQSAGEAGREEQCTSHGDRCGFAKREHGGLRKVLL